MSTVVFLANTRDTTTPTTIYAKDEVVTIADEAMLRAFQRDGKVALTGAADVRSIRVSPIAATTATINWVVDQACTGMLVNYGTTTAVSSSQAATPASGTGAIVANLTGLTTATLYYYRISVTVGTSTTLSPTYTFTTA
jgi:hypothetical protein